MIRATKLLLRRGALALAVLASLGTSACVGTPSPLAPGFAGSVGLPHQGSLTGGVALAERGEGFVRFRRDGMRWGNPRLVSTIEHAARTVARRAPGGAPLVVGDLSAELGGKRIRVNALLPGGTDTPAATTNAPGAGPEVLAFVEGIHALKRMAQPEEIARAALFLASDASSFVTGTAFLADGGVSIQRG